MKSSKPCISPRLTITAAITALLAALLLAVGAMAANDAPPPSVDMAKPKNVILLIGDGMGTAHMTMARIATIGADGQLAMDRLPFGGLLTTHPDDNSIVTDSAAAGTALATGFKTNNQSISMSADGQTVYKTVLEKAQEKGKATGLVSTTRITHATPAVFASHIDHRDKEAEIAAQMSAANVDVILGGGSSFFIPQTEKGSKRKDDRNLIQELKDKGYSYASDRAGLMAAEGANKLLGLFGSSHVVWELDRDPEKVPSLVEMTDSALQMLSKDPDGFFLMVEGGRIDHASHAWDGSGVIAETIAFDNAVEAAINFANNKGNTLVIVTADHDNAGLRLARGDLGVNPWVLNNTKISYEKYGSLLKGTDGSEAAIRELVANQSGIFDLTSDEVKAIQDAIKLKPGDAGYGEYALTDPIMEVISKRAAISWTTHEHEGSMVPLLADGPSAALFGGVRDNTYVGKTLMGLLD